MSSSSATKKDWRLSQEAFDLLLAALDDDRERAGEKYEVLRRKLVKFFEWHGGARPEDLSDEALNVTARKLLEGEVVRNVSSYCLGVGRNLLIEDARRRVKEQATHNDPVFLRTGADADEEQLLLECLEQCLDRLPAESRRLLLTYYGGDRCAKIDARKALAADLGVPINALRIRAWRLRQRLERDVEELMAATTRARK